MFALYFSLNKTFSVQTLYIYTVNSVKTFSFSASFRRQNHCVQSRNTL